MRKSSKKCLILVILFLTIFVLMSINVSAASNAEKYAPILYFEGEETCYPIDASYHIDNSDKKRVNEDGTELVTEETNNSNETKDMFYDNKHGTVDNDGVINHYQSVEKNYGYTVYYRETNDNGNAVIQYWMFYAFNKGELNKHEGDWEMVQVVIPSSGYKWVAYSQHHSGQRASWDMVEKDGDNIKVFVARGSHANYLRPFSGKLGVSADIVGDNGKVLEPSDYQLKSLEDQDWVDFEGRWGEVGEDMDDAVSGMFLGKVGPQGPQFRESGNMWDSPVSWGQGIPEASSLFFMLEWLVYNFVTLFLVITAIILLLTLFSIYRRHKRYGLGPRICSIFYIDGLNLKSMGNILCLIGVAVAITALFTQWYGVSYEFYSEGSGNGVSGLETEGMQDLLTIDGIKGLQVVIPGENGLTPVMSLLLPFSLFLGVGLAFLFLKAVGINTSRKLGGKYIFRGIRLMVPIIIIVIGIISLGAMIPENVTNEQNSDSYGADIITSITNSPLGGSKNIEISEENFTGHFSLNWGLRQGGQMLIFSGIILITAGIFMIASKSVLFEPKTPSDKKRKKDRKKLSQQPQTNPQAPPPQQQSQQTLPPPLPVIPPENQTPPQQPQNMPPPPPPPKKPEKKEETTPPLPPPDLEEKDNFCTNCGYKLEKDAVFCPECGNKINEGDSKNQKK